MKVEWMRGCATALVTPFQADGGVDLERMRALVGRQVVGGVKLLVPCGTTGESVTMSTEERESVIAAAVEVGQGRARVIAGTGSNSTAHAVEQSVRAAELGADAVLVNTAVALAKNPPLMAEALRLGVEAGRKAYLTGRIATQREARPSSPTEGISRPN